MGNIADKLVFPIPNNSRSVNSIHDALVDDRVEWIENKESGYSIPVIKIRGASPRAVILYSHGNAEDMYSINEYLEHMMIELQVDIWCWDYAGYGPHQLKDDTIPTEENVYSDIRTLTNALIEDSMYVSLPKFMWGRSLGTAPSIHASVEYEDNIDGLIIESGLRSCVRVIHPAWVAASIHSVFDMFDNETEIKKLRTVPVIIIHGKQDTLIPYEHSQCLLAACNSPKEHLWINGGTHNNIDSEFKVALFERVHIFIEEYAI